MRQVSTCPDASLQADAFQVLHVSRHHHFRSPDYIERLLAGTSGLAVLDHLRKGGPGGHRAGLPQHPDGGILGLSSSMVV